MLYHLSNENNLTYLIPQIPKCAVIGFEDIKTKRVCFSDSINKCLCALNSNAQMHYVYIIDENISSGDIHHPSVNEVGDVNITDEVWITRKIKVKCIGKIKSIYFNWKKLLDTDIGCKIINFYYSYFWVEKYLELY